MLLAEHLDHQLTGLRAEVVRPEDPAPLAGGVENTCNLYRSPNTCALLVLSNRLFNKSGILLRDCLAGLNSAFG